MVKKIIIVVLVAIIMIINVLHLSSNAVMGQVSFGIGRATLVFTVISFSFCIINLPVILPVPKIVLLIFWFGVVSFMSTVINIDRFEIIDFLNTSAFVLYWVSAFLISYTIVTGKFSLMMFSINCMSLTFPIIVYYYFLIVVFFNFFGTETMLGLNQSYYILSLLPFLMSLRKNSLKLFGILIVLIAMIMSNKRGGTVAFLGALGIFFIMIIVQSKSKFKNRLSGISFIIISGIILFIIFNYLSDRTNLSLAQRFQDIGTDRGSGRLDIWKDTYRIQMDSDFPGWIFGHGYDAVSLSSVRKSAHNDFQEVLYDYGIIAFWIYLSIYFQLFKYCKRMYSQNYPLLAPFSASFIMFIVISSISHLVIYPTYFIYFAFFWGIVIADFENKSKNFRSIE
ncbi:MAG: O-antigen ligase family protein [Bacteroidales bacterium]|nr:O-antigen ligase family protein [Bacteroidales bacterium]